MARLDIQNLKQWLAVARQSGYRASVLSKELRISRRQLQRYTQEMFGLSPQCWLNEQRLVLARRLLMERRSVKEITFGLGFRQISHFSREFKLFYGLSPNAFLVWTERQNRSRDKVSWRPTS